MGQKLSDKLWVFIFVLKMAIVWNVAIMFNSIITTYYNYHTNLLRMRIKKEDPSSRRCKKYLVKNPKFRKIDLVHHFLKLGFLRSTIYDTFDTTQATRVLHRTKSEPKTRRSIQRKFSFGLLSVIEEFQNHFLDHKVHVQ